jgi:hypothetical protein
VRRFGGFIAAESVASGVLLGNQLLCSFGCFLVLFLWLIFGFIVDCFQQHIQDEID